MRSVSSAKKRSSEGVSRSALVLAVPESTPRDASRCSTAAASLSAFALRAGTTSAQARPGPASTRAQHAAAPIRPQWFTRVLPRLFVVVDHVIAEAEAGGEEGGPCEALEPQVDRLAGEHVLLADGLDAIGVGGEEPELGGRQAIRARLRRGGVDAERGEPLFDGRGVLVHLGLP